MKLIIWYNNEVSDVFFNGMISQETECKYWDRDKYGNFS